MRMAPATLCLSGEPRWRLDQGSCAGQARPEKQNQQGVSVPAAWACVCICICVCVCVCVCVERERCQFVSRSWVTQLWSWHI